MNYISVLLQFKMHNINLNNLEFKSMIYSQWNIFPRSLFPGLLYRFLFHLRMSVFPKSMIIIFFCTP